MIFIKQLILLLILFFFMACSSKEIPLRHAFTCKSNYYNLLSSTCLNEEDSALYLAKYKVIFIGDHHGENDLHVKIASLVKTLHNKGYRIHIANEWFTPEDNVLLKKYQSKELNVTTFLKDVNWSENVGYSFDSYSKIYDTNSSLYGINMSRAFRKKISMGRIKEMNAFEKKFYTALDLNTSIHKQLVLPYMSHCEVYKKREEQNSCEKRMYRVQVAWDTYMAEQSYLLSKRVLLGDKDILIVFAGSMHLAYLAGINMRFSRRSKEPSITLLPYENNDSTVGAGYSDFLLFYTPHKEEK